MAMPLAFGAMPPEINIARLLGGPGVISTLVSSATYSLTAAQLNAAAAAFDGSTSEMATTWQGLSSSNAQGAFRNYAAWLREQAAVAETAGKLVDVAAGAFATAQSEMLAVEAWLASFRLRETAMLAASATMPGAAAGMLAMEMEYLAIWGAAAGVMGGYAGEVVPALAALPPPLTAPPIVTGGGTDMMNLTNFDPPSPPPGPPSGPPSGPTDPTGPNGPTGTDGPTGSTNEPTPDGKDLGSVGDKDPTGLQSTDPTDSTTPTDADRLAPDMRSSGSGGDSGNYGYDGGSAEQQGFSGTSPYSTTLAGLNGGVGSLVGLGMLSGGVGQMSGTSTGFRMPSNWNPGAGRAFGAVASEPSVGPANRAPRRGVSAPEARMRRRRRDKEENKKSKVFVPGEFEEVPVLEKPPIVGVIEYADGDRRDDFLSEQTVAVGVIEREEDDAPVALSERPR